MSSPSIVVASVIERNGRYLVGRRPPHKHHGGLWEFPGGKVRDGESLVEGIARELSEELDLVITQVGAELGREDDPGGDFRIVFVRVATAGEPSLGEHDELRWCLWNELRSLDLAPADARFVRARKRVEGERGR